MSTKETNQIDDLFRDELSDYKVPVALSALPVIGVAVKKGLFYKLSLLKLNVFYVIAIGVGTATSVGVGALKIYEHYQNKHVAMHSVPTATGSVTKETTSSINLTDTHEQSTNVMDVKTSNQMLKDETRKTAATTSAAGNSIQTKGTAVSSQPIVYPHNQKNTTIVSDKQATKTASASSTLSKTALNGQTTKDIVTTTTVTQTEVEISSTTDSSHQAVAPVRKIVYVKPKPVIIQDTIVRVIKKTITK